MNILGIETSCDETAVAIYHSRAGLLSHQVYSQVEMHNEFGGVVPELASRDHIRKIVPLVRKSLADANLTMNQLDGVAYTAGPGLMGALLVGSVFARSLAAALDIPAVAVHHMEAHLLAPLLEENPPPFPFVALLVSGGHTQLIAVEKIGDYRLLGESVDDAAGEAFDKVAKMLGFSYPGGPIIARLAKQGRADHYHFPRPMLDRDNLDFSFSGLKTAVVYAWQKSDQSEQAIADIAASFQAAVVDTLIAKCLKALKTTGKKCLVVAGGVSANESLREKLMQQAAQNDFEVYYPRLAFCTDNGAMVALTGCHYLQQGKQDSLAIQVKPRWPWTN